MNRFVCWFVKITGWLPFILLSRPKFYYEDDDKSLRKIKGSAIIVPDHHSVWDYATMMYAFPRRNIRCVVAELMFEKNKFMNWLLKRLGCFKVDRRSNDFAFVQQAREHLARNGVVEIFPESRIPREGEPKPLPFKESAAHIAMGSHAPVYLVVSNGQYFSPDRLRVLIHKPIYVEAFCDPALSDKENIKRITAELRTGIARQQKLLQDRIKQDETTPKNNFFYDFVKVTGALPALIGLRPKVRHTDRQRLKQLKGMLVCANHNSILDPVALTCALWRRRVSFVAAKELYNTPVKNFFFTNVQCIQADRENFTMDALHRILDKLKAGKAVAIFPEGKLVDSQQGLSSMKSGAVLMAYQAAVPILPVYLVSPKKWYHRAHIITGSPIDVRAQCKSFPSVKELEGVMEQIRRQQQQLKELYEQSHRDT